MNNTELCNHIKQCTDLDELRLIYSTTVAEIDRDHARMEEITDEIARLRDEYTSIKERRRCDVWDLSALIRERIGELVLTGSHVDIAGTQGHN